MFRSRSRANIELHTTISTMRAEVQDLREENARLRLDHQRPIAPAETADRLRQRVEEATAFSDAGDDAWAALTEASVLRDALLNVCQELAVCASTIERQLVSMTPAPEIDRRATDRRNREIRLASNEDSEVL